MSRIALLLEYNGKSFSGSQHQKNARTVQSELEAGLSCYLKEPIKTVFSGRTDSGVHATGQIVHFDCQLADVDLWRLLWALNGILPQDMSVKAAQIVPQNFHARLSAIERQYVYRILNRSQRSAIYKDNHYFVSYALNYKSMAEAAELLVGRHDFASFKSSNSDNKSTVCDITFAEILQLSEGRLEFCIGANHFVYNMVRIIVGSLIEIGLGKNTIASIAEALNKRDRDLAGPTAPAWGLTLVKVNYPEHYDLFANDSFQQASIDK